MKIRTQGFTLIELLVVISIIALLSSVVLSSLGTARNKGYDNTVKATMKEMLPQAQAYLDSHSSLGASISSCSSTSVFTDSQFALMRANVVQNITPGASMTCATDSSGTKWAVSVSSLRGGGTWCIDNSQGWFKAGTANTATGACQ
ncbi:MAG TPA: prepilin-type N-terminal cleavage/methylation domain-containing protein [Candidatus Paceibacterota bacterium]|jgi:prepilin-type N-terminal cleavage/methylation domain